MKEIKREVIYKLRGLFEQIIKEMNGPLTADEAIVKFDRAYQGNYLKIFTDDIENPKHCLILAVYPGMIHSGFICTVVMMYSSPEVRNASTLDEMHRITEEFAHARKCEQILGSAWKYRGSRGIDSMWTGKGYEIQETVYVKNL